MVGTGWKKGNTDFSRDIYQKEGVGDEKGERDEGEALTKSADR